MLSSYGWIDGITASGVVIFGILFGLGIPYQKLFFNLYKGINLKI